MGSTTNIFVTSLVFLAVFVILLGFMNNEATTSSYFIGSDIIISNVTSADAEEQLQHCWDLYGYDGSEGTDGMKLYACRIAVSESTGTPIGAAATDLGKWIGTAFDILFYPVHITEDAIQYTTEHTEYAALLIPVISFAIFFIGYKIMLILRGTSD